MRPAGRYVVRNTGCGWFIGVIFIISGIVVLLTNIGPHWKIGTYWPVILIATGGYLLLRHYYLLATNRNAAADVFDVGIIPRLQGRNRSWRPPAFPVVIMAIGVCWLLYNLLSKSQRWIIWVVVLIALGLLMLGGSVRASLTRT